LYNKRAKVNDRASKDLYPPDNSLKLLFQTLLNATPNSKPSEISLPSIGYTFAKAPGNKSEKIYPKALFTYK
jgi:hypothetical protein